MVLINIQCLRAVAALMVVWLHAKEQIPGMNTYFRSGFGAAGVDLFFVISGLIMVVSTANKDATPIQFFVRRLQRIAPLYWLATTLLVLVALVAPQLQRSTTLYWPHVVASYLFIPMESPWFQGYMWPVLVPGWTLNYEMAFYAIFAVSLFFRSALRLPFLAVVIAGVALSGLVFDVAGVASFYSNDVMLTFVLGALIGKLVVRSSFKTNVSAGAVCLLLAPLTWIALEALAIPSRFLNAGIPAALVVLGFCYLPTIRSRVTQWMVSVGDASYSVYLTHIFTLAILRIAVKALGIPVMTEVHYWLFMFGSLLACSLAGLCSYRVVEQPIAKFFRR